MGDSSSKALHEAVAAGDVAECRSQLADLAKLPADERWHVDDVDDAGYTSLQGAAYFGHASIITLLHEHGVEVYDST